MVEAHSKPCSCRSCRSEINITFLYTPTHIKELMVMIVVMVVVILYNAHCAHKQGSNLVIVLVCPESGANDNEVGLPWPRKAPRRVLRQAPRKVSRPV